MSHSDIVRACYLVDSEITNQSIPKTQRVNNIAFCATLKNLTSEQLVVALTNIIEKYPVLRTCTAEGNNKRNYHDTEIPVVKVWTYDAQYLSRAELETVIAKKFLHVFEPDEPLHIHADWYRCDEQEAMVVLVFDRRFIDEHSYWLLLDELYASLSSQKVEWQSALSFREYQHWQQQWLTGSEAERQRLYWQGALAGDLPILNLSAGDETTLPVTGWGQLTRKIPDTLVQKMQAAALAYDNDLSVLFLAAYQLLLHRHTGMEEIIIGTVMRECDSWNGIVGNCSNQVALRSQSENHLTVSEHISHAQKLLREAEKNSNYPFETLLDALGIRVSVSAHPVFQTAILFQDISRRSRRLSFLRNTEQADNENVASFRIITAERFPCPVYVDTTLPLLLSIVKTARGTYCDFHYNPQLFEADSIALWMDHLFTLLSSMSENEQRQLSELSMLSEQERQQVLYEFNTTVTPYPQESLIHQLFEERVRMAPQAVALRYGETEISYGELNRRANQVAHRLLAQGICPDARVAICVERSPEMVVGLLGILKAGGAYVPLDPNYPQTRLEYMLADSQPVMLLTQHHLQTLLPAAENSVLLLDNPDEWQGEPEYNPDAGQLGLTPHHLAYVIYTSGSTGQPKGVMVEHRSIVNLALDTRYTQINPEDCIAHCAKIAFDAASWEVWGALLNGAVVLLIPEPILLNPETFKQALKTGGATALFLTTALFNQYLEVLAPVFSSLKYLLFGGEKLPVERTGFIRQHVQAEHILHMYGPSENTTFSTSYEIVPHHGDTRVLPIGTPTANTRIYILDEQGEPVPIGVAGEIHIAGAGVARGYLNRPQLTAERFIIDPYSPQPGGRMYKTGDLGRWLADGNIEFLGRNDFQVKIRGFRIELGEIESALMACKGVQEAVVIAREESTGDKRLVAYLIAKGGTALVPETLRSILKESLAGYMIPSAFVQLSAFPLTPNGKLDRKALPEPGQDALVVREYEAPKGELEIRLAEIWQELLGVERVGRQDNFFELGGHSLLVVGLLEQLLVRKLYLAVQEVYAVRTLAEMALKLRRGILQQLSVPENRIPPACQTITPDMLPLIALEQTDIECIVARTAGGATNIQDIYPLAPLQEGMLFYHLLGKTGDLYLLRYMLSFDNRRSMQAFIEALQKVIDRHDILRTSIQWQDLPEPVQVVYRCVVLPQDELKPASQELAFTQLQEKTDPRCLHRDITQAPLLSTTFIEESPGGKCFLALVCHHMVCDHVTLEQIFNEARVILMGEEHSLPPTRPYRDFIAQLRFIPQAEHEAYFQQQLGDISEPTVPFGLLDIYSEEAEMDEAVLALDTELSRTIRECVRQLGVSAAVLFHVVWAQVLAKCSSQEEVVFGTVLLGRSQGGIGLDQAVGLFINTLPLRVSLGSRSVVQVIRETHHRLSELLMHEQAPLAVAQRCSGVMSPLPLFNSLLNYRHSEAGEDGLARLPAWDGGCLLSEEERTGYPLAISVDDMGQRFALTAQSSGGINASRMIAYVETALRDLLLALTHTPEQAIGTVMILPEQERTQILRDFNNTAVPYPQESLTHQLFEEQVRIAPQAVALRYGEMEVSYGELNRRANRVAHRLLAQGIRPDDRVAICVERSPEMVVGLLGIMKAGGAYVPLDPAYPQTRLEYMLADSQPSVVLTQQHLQTQLSAAGAPVLLLDSPQVWEAQPEENPDPGHIGLTPDHLAYVIYTSGSTGQPKGVMVEHRGVVNLACAQAAFFNLNAKSCVLQFASFSFDASVLELCMPLSQGGKLCLAAKDELMPGEALMRTLEYYQCSHVILPPSALTFLAPERFSPGLSVIVAGEKCPAAMASQWASRHFFFNAYGPSEATVCSSIYACQTENGEPLPIGRPMDNTRIYILDSDDQPVPIGVTGEIYIAGAGVARGYLNRPELTAERFIPDPFSTESGTRMYKTGDLGRWLADGNIEYLGRNDFQVKIRGFRIELEEIEARLAECAGVQDVVVIAREESTSDKRLVAYLVAQNSVTLEPSALRAHLSECLAEYMIPGAFVQLAAFPLTPNGKLDRKALPEPGQDARVMREYEAPQEELEIHLAEIWQELLGVERVGRQDNFFDLGGHSLLAIRLASRLRHTMGIELRLSDLFTVPCLKAFAQRLRIAEGTTEQTILLADRKQAIPLSSAQQRLWFLDRLDSAAGAAYHIPAAISLTGQLNVEALQAALDHIVARHEILRTSFSLNEGEARQIIAAVDTGFALRQRDLGHLAAEEQQQAVKVIRTEEARQAFDLNVLPLIRGQLLCLDKEQHILLFTQHHIISDGWSVSIFFQELSLLYDIYSRGEADELPELAVQYADYAVWQRSWMQGEVLARQVGYWCQQLSGAPTLLELPTDRPRPPEQSYTGKSLSVSLSPELTTGLKELAYRHGATLFMALLSGWSILLARYSGQNDIVVGTPVANRQHQELEPLIGFFVNTLALRVSMKDNPSVSQLLEQVKRNALEAYGHQDLPFEQVVEAVQPPRSLAHSPIFQSMLALDNTPKHHLQLPGLSITLLETEVNTTHFDLSLSFTETEQGGLEGGIDYATDLFDESSIRRMASHLERILQGMVADEQQTVQALPLLSVEEQRALLQGFNDTAAPYPSKSLVHQLFEEQVRIAPQAVALRYGEMEVSYGELNRRANRVAHRLLAQGIRPDDRVAICVERSPEMVAGLLGILKAGGAYVPLDPAYPQTRLEYMLADSQPSVVLTLQHLQTQLSAAGAPVLLLDSPQVWEAQPEENPDPGHIGLTPDHLAYVIYTSGSTGQPKGVMVEHRGVVNLACAQAAFFNLNAKSCVLQFASFSFDASVSEWCMTLSQGGKLCLAAKDELMPGEALMRTLEYYQCSHVTLPPSALTFLAPEHFSPGLSVIVAGEKCPAAMASQWASRHFFFNAYGPSEATVCSSIYACQTENGEPLPIGRPMDNTRIYILDSDDQPVPIGVTGEIYIAGAGVARGYLNRPELTAERFIPDPFSTESGARMYKTGDLGRWLADGNIEYLGRNDFQVKIRGFRIELGEIEARLAECAGVREVVVTVREDSREDKSLVAYLVAEDGVTLEPAILRARLSGSLADYMIPGAFVQLTAFPLTPNGKLDRKALPEPGQDARVMREYEGPQGEQEIRLAEIWQELLGVERVGRQDNFFELGGHSLLIVSLQERLRISGFRLAVQTVFTAPTLSAMALKLSSEFHHSIPVPANLIVPGGERITPEMLPLVTLTQDDIDRIVNQVEGGANNIQDIYSLAPLQEGILFHYLLESEGDPYLSRILLAFDSRQRVDEFLLAWQQVISRHDILRSAILWQGLSEPIQVVYRQVQMPLRELSLTAQDPALEQLNKLTDPCRVRMDITRAPLFSATIAEDRQSGEWILALLSHHLVCDHLSFEIMINEIQCILRGEGDELPPSLPYRNFIAQIRSVPEAEHEAYFRQQLGDVCEPTAPFGLLDVHDDGADTEESALVLDRELVSAIRECARQQGVSVAVLFHVVWAQVLAKCSGQDDVVFGTVLLGRSQGVAGADQVLGLFINTLPVRIQLGSRSVYQVVHETYQRLSELLAHEQASLAVAQRCSGVMSPLPLFNSLLNYRHSQPQEGENSQLILRGVRILSAEERTNYPLALSIDDFGQGFILTVKSSRRIAASRVIAYIETALRDLLLALTHTPEQAIETVGILPEQERVQILQKFNKTAVPYPQESLIHQLFEEQVRMSPQAVALRHGETELSYGELNRQANQVAHCLLAQGIYPDDRVAICVERTPEMIIGLLGILKAGGAYVPLDPAYPKARLEYMLADSQPVMVLTQHHLQRVLPTVETPVLLLDNHRVWESQPEDNPNAGQLGLTSHHLAYVIYTSGSTGQPKGVMVEHNGIVNLAEAQGKLFNIARKSRVLQFASFSFDACTWEWIMALSRGAALCLATKETLLPGEPLMQTLHRYQISHVTLPPSALSYLNCNHLPTEMTVIVAGEKFPAILASQWAAKLHCFNAYGPSEITACASAYYCQLNNTEPLPIGSPIANTQIYILDAYGAPVPIGVGGEIYIAGAGVARGYLNRQELTAERFVANPFSDQRGAKMYKTGDLGRWLADGNIEYLGRNDFQVKIRGFRIELGEVESVLMACEGVQEAVVIAREEGTGDKRLVAYLVAQDGVTLKPASLREHLSGSLADYMIPGAFVQMAVFPLTPNGKLDRKALPEPEQDARVIREYEMPQGELEIRLAEIWQELLGVERIGRHDNFFELGGHSLLLMSLIDKLYQQLNIRLKMEVLLSSPSVSQLAHYCMQSDMDSANLTSAANICTISRHGDEIPLFFVHHGNGGITYAYDLTNAMGDIKFPVYGILPNPILQDEHTLPVAIQSLAALYIVEMQKIQPSGPYRIAGWSGGGAIAYEIASQLLAAGEIIDFIGLLDTQQEYLSKLSVDDINLFSAFDEIEMLRSLLPELGIEEQFREQIISLYREQDDKAISQLIKKNGNKSVRHLPEYQHIKQFLLLSYGIGSAIYSYEPPMLPVQITLFAATENKYDLISGWKKFIPDERLLVIPVEGNHFSMMESPQLEKLGRQLSHAINRTERSKEISVRQVGYA